MEEQIETDRPNVLFIITDQHRSDHVGFMGNEVVQTPNLDAIAQRGVIFDNGWVANPVCMPNRSSIVTGRLPSAHGVIFNDRSLELGAATHVRQFRNAGYRTALFGKSHLQHGMSRDSIVEVPGAPTLDHGYPAGWDSLEHEEAYGNGAPDWPEDFYGFGHVELSIDHGARITGHHLHWALDKGARYEDLVAPYSDESPARKRSSRWWQIFEPVYEAGVHSTAFVAERTMAFIAEAAQAQEPWYAWASFPDPHHPMTPPAPWFDRHDPADMTLPVSISDPLEAAPEYLRRIQGRHPSGQRSWVAPCGAEDTELLKEAIAATYGTVEFIDDAVGRIMSLVEQLGQLDNTIVVFTADHGDMMGEHGLMLKGFMPFNGTQRVPYVVCDPRRSPGRTNALASSVDFAPTLMDLCGIDTHDGVQGESLVPVLDGDASSVRDHILIEDDLRRQTAERARIPFRIRTVVGDDGLKYTRFSSGESMLFDLEVDPHELDELGQRGRARHAVATERLADALMLASDDARGAPVHS